MEDLRKLKIKDSIINFTNDIDLRLKKKKDSERVKLLGLDSSEATTIFSSILILRDSKKPLTEVDLENYISQAIWKFFDRHRSEAARRLKINEIDIVLNDARVVRIKVDGHQVLNPEGFEGKEIEICLGGTLMERNKAVNSMHVFETGTLNAYLLLKDKGIESAIYAEIMDDITRVFFTTDTYTSFLDEFDWGKNDLLESISLKLGIDMQTSEGVYESFLNNQVSTRIEKLIKEIFDSSFSNFIKGLDACVNNFSSLGTLKNHPIFVKSFNFPESIYSKQFPIGKNKSKIIKPKELEFERMLSVHIYDLHKDLNNLAQKRLKWLMPSSV